MATTNVPKGAGRPAAAAKSRKHAQRTPLPPRKGSPGAQAIEAASCQGGEEAHFAHLDLNGECPWNHASDRAEKAEKPMGERTVAELRKVASELLVPGARSMTKGALLNAILEAERAKASTTKRLAGRDLATEVFATAEKSKPATPPGPKLKAKPAEDIVDCTGADIPAGQQKSIAKAEAFLAAAASLGWAEQTRSAPTQEEYGVIVGRGEERIAISWRLGVFVGEECYHSHPGRTPRKVINASAAKKIMAIPPAQADEEARRVSSNKSARPRRDRAAEDRTAGRRALPFDADAATDEEIVQAVFGRRISWTNEISGAIEDAHVTGPVGDISIQPGKSGRSVRFTATTGFRSVRVSSILSVR